LVDLWPDAEVGEMVSDGTVLSFEAATAITKGKAVYLSADMIVSQCIALTQYAIGIALKTVAIGEFCPVCVKGPVKVTCGGNITRGSAIQTDANGNVVVVEAAAVVGDVVDRISRTLGIALQTFAVATNDTGLIYVDKA